MKGIIVVFGLLMGAFLFWRTRRSDNVQDRSYRDKRNDERLGV